MIVDVIITDAVVLIQVFYSDIFLKSFKDIHLLFYPNINKKPQKCGFLTKNRNKVYAKNKLVSGKF